MDGLESQPGSKQIYLGSTSTPPQRVTISTVLQELEDEDFRLFKVYLCEDKSIPWSHLEDADRVDTSFQIRQSYHDKALDVAMEVLKRMDRNDLVETFSHQAKAVPHPEKTMAYTHIDALQESTMGIPLRILKALDQLTDDQFKRFKWLLRQPNSVGGFKPLKTCAVEKAERRTDVVDLIVQAFPGIESDIMADLLPKVKIEG